VCGFKTHLLKHLLFKVIPKRPPGQYPYLMKVVSMKISDQILFHSPGLVAGVS